RHVEPALHRACRPIGFLLLCASGSLPWIVGGGVLRPTAPRRTLRVGAGGIRTFGTRDVLAPHRVVSNHVEGRHIHRGRGRSVPPVAAPRSDVSAAGFRGRVRAEGSRRTRTALRSRPPGSPAFAGAGEFDLRFFRLSAGPRKPRPCIGPSPR